MTTFKLYGIWNALLTQWLTDPCRTRRVNLIWLTPAYTAGAGRRAVLGRAGAGQRDSQALGDWGQSRQPDAAVEPVSGQWGGAAGGLASAGGAPALGALVEAMFMAELQDLLLTAGHDLAALALPLTLDVARGDERYTLLRGEEQTLKPGDMFVSDAQGVISSILYGPDQRTQITPATQQAVFTAYAPSGLAPETVAAHLQTLLDNVRVIAPKAEVLWQAVVPANA